MSEIFDSKTWNDQCMKNLEGGISIFLDGTVNGKTYRIARTVSTINVVLAEDVVEYNAHLCTLVNSMGIELLQKVKNELLEQLAEIRYQSELPHSRPKPKLPK